jgi:hypothetical protein
MAKNRGEKMKRIVWAVCCGCVAVSSGCAFPSIAGGQGSLVDGAGRERPVERQVAVYFWDHPSSSNGASKVEVVDIQPVLKYPSTVDYPARLYWMIWTPALGLQHIAPQKCVLLCSSNAPAIEIHPEYGQRGCSCCFPGDTDVKWTVPAKQTNPITLSADDQQRWAAQRSNLLKRLDASSNLTPEDRKIVIHAIDAYLK